MLILQHVNEAYWKHSSSFGRPLQRAFHPVVVVGLLVRDDYHFALAKRKLVLVVGLAVVQRSTSSHAVDVRRCRL